MTYLGPSPRRPLPWKHAVAYACLNYFMLGARDVLTALVVPGGIANPLGAGAAAFPAVGAVASAVAAAAVASRRLRPVAPLAGLAALFGSSWPPLEFAFPIAFYGVFFGVLGLYIILLADLPTPRPPPPAAVWITPPRRWP